ncbi:PilZ domain-containing protein [Sphingomonas piscis]|uniref:PilZ domain-containing protein n=1 Tax=Sphingomonas piscis TaxID=2714943 RepID=A0A6G7YRR9_9SPHN|nr:PilZ domain-containing protein [Sphingomonas piscis]
MKAQEDQLPDAAKRPARVRVLQPATVTRSSGEEQAVTVTDISANGFSLEGQSGLSVGEQIYLRLGKQGNVQGEIRWVAEAKAGGMLFESSPVGRT